MTGADRLQLVGDFASCGNEVHIGAMRFDIPAWDGKGTHRPVIETTTLPDFDVFQYLAVRHRSPA